MASLNKYYNVTMYIDKEYDSLKEFLYTFLSKRNYLKMIRSGYVTLNGDKTDHFTTDIKIGDCVEVYLPYIKPQRRMNKVEPNFEILFENKHILVINKDANVLSIPSTNKPEDLDVTSMVFSYYLKSKINSVVHVLTRLDKDTSGCMIIAKNSYAHQKLSEQQKNNEVNKNYQVIVNGEPITDNIIEAPIARKDDSIIERCIDFENGKYAKTEITNIETKGSYKLVDLKLHTGRTHQIRLHMNYLKNYVVGDYLYNPNQEAKRQLLHCNYIEFKDIETNELIKVNAPWKDDMKEFWENK